MGQALKLYKLLLVYSATVQLLVDSCIYQPGVCHENITQKHKESTVYLLTIFPYPQPNSSVGTDAQPAWNGGPCVVPAAELAVKHINQAQNVLQGHRLKLIHADGGCNVTIRARISFITHIQREKKPIIGIVGPGCSESATAVSSLTGRGSLVLPNVHTAISAELEDRQKYPYTFGIIGSAFQIVEAVFSFISYYHLDNVAALYDDTGAYLYSSRRLDERIQRGLSNTGRFISHVYDTFIPIEALKSSGAKVVIVLSTLTLSQKILCIAHHEGMVFPEYQWILVGYTYSTFVERITSFYYNGNPYMCNWTAQEYYKTSLRGALFFNFRLLPQNRSIPLVSGLTFHDTVEQYHKQAAAHHHDTCPQSMLTNNLIWANTVYDAVWAIAIALNKHLDNISTNFQYVHFNGATGYIKFDKETGYVQRHVNVFQITDSGGVLVGSILNGNVTPNKNSPPVLINTSSRYASVNPFLSAFFVLIYLILLIFTVTVHVMSLLKRKHPSVKASSPILNHFVFASCYLTVTNALLFILVIKTFGIPSFGVVGNVCHVIWVWLFPISSTLSVGVLIAKTWRIYRIFIHFRDPGPFISTKALVMIVVVQLSIDTIIATAWSAISPITLKIVEGGVAMNEDGEIIITRQCVFTNTIIWLGLLGAYKLFQMLLLLALCLLTRSVKDRRFSTTSLTIGTYLSLLLSFIVVPVYAILWFTNTEIHADFVLLCIYQSAIILVLLVFVLAPPLLPLLKSHWLHYKKPRPVR